MASIVPNSTANVPDSADKTSAKYTGLIERAVDFVRAHGGACHEDLLIAHVFGNAGHIKMWRPLLRQALEPCSELSLRVDSHWVVPDLDRIGGDTQTPVLREFVAIDVETTGARPTTQRVIEVAAVRFRDGVEVGRYESLLNPDRRLPKFIIELTGIRDADLLVAPRFKEIADELIEFIGPAVIAGHNVKFDLGFIDAELRRAGFQVLANERIDTVGLAVRLLPGVRKPSLDRVATALALPTRSLHRAGIDAELCGRVAIKLLHAARLAGIGDVDLVKALANSTGPRPKDKLGRSRSAMDRSLLDEIPSLTGVYLMHDRFDHIIYIGKAKNLRDRVGSYYSQPVGYTRKMDGLLEHLARIETVVVGSEIEALLLESQLIRRYQPRYNTALRASERYPLIRLDVSNPWPRLTLCKERKDDGASYFGPFRNTGGARRTVEFLNDMLPLRTCPRSFRDARSYGSPCIQLDLGKCLGPCVGRANRDEYLSIVRHVSRFLEGDDAVLLDRLHSELIKAAAKLDFERATKIRNDLKTAQQLSASQRQMANAGRDHNVLVVQPAPRADHRTVMLVIGGRRWAQFDTAIDDTDWLANELSRSWTRYLAASLAPIDHEAVDEAIILNRWLGQRADHAAIIAFDPTRVTDATSWAALVGAALSRSIAEITATPTVIADAVEDADPEATTPAESDPV